MQFCELDGLMLILIVGNFLIGFVSLNHCLPAETPNPQAIKFLEKKQETVCKKYGLRCDLFTEADAIKQIEDMAQQGAIDPDPNHVEAIKQECHNFFKILPTKFEVEPFYAIIFRRMKAIEEVASLRDWKITPEPVFGTVPSGSINATTYSPQDGTFVFIFDGGLTVYSQLFSKIIVKALAVEEHDRISLTLNKDKFQNRIKSDPAIVARFLELLDACIFEANSAAAKRYILDKRYNQPIFYFNQSFELFVVGHEYAHGVRRHYEVLCSEKYRQGAQEEQLRTCQMLEFEADLIGFYLSRLAQEKQKIDLAVAFSGPTLFFIFDDIRWRALSTTITGKELPYPTKLGHPSPLMRLRMLRVMLQEKHPDKDAADAALDLSEKLEGFVETLWEASRKHFIDMHLQEKQAAPIMVDFFKSGLSD
jgi:hypothetical protein